MACTTMWLGQHAGRQACSGRRLAHLLRPLQGSATVLQLVIQEILTKWSTRSVGIQQMKGTLTQCLADPKAALGGGGGGAIVKKQDPEARYRNNRGEGDNDA